MLGFYFLIPVLLTVFTSFLVVRAASIALMMTGLAREKARFQALSAFTGTGYTTKEAESVVNHPKRRKIVTWLMIMGNAGLVTVIITATSSLVTSRGYQLPINIIVLIAGIFIIYKIATHKGFIRKWENYIEDKLVKSATFEEDTTEDLLHFLEGYGLVREIVTEDSPLINNSIEESRLSKKKTLVLGIERGSEWIPIPKANEKIKKGDKLIVYGPFDVLKNLLKER